MREQKPFEWIHPSPVQVKPEPGWSFFQAIPPRLLGVIWELAGALGVAGELRLTVEFSGRELHAQRGRRVQAEGACWIV
jgi:hypothetical protein